MNKRFLSIVIMILPALMYAQNESNSAINWVNGLSWQQVKQKAKKENKYIFVDCFTTWCGPCKEMDKKVYTVDSVGSYLNTGFISVKLQMDSTKSDDDATRSWYKTASLIRKEFKISAYPTLLFFNPGGEMVSKEIGYRDPRTLLSTARNAKDPSKQYYVLLNNYKNGTNEYGHMPYLIRTSKQLGDTSTYNELLPKYYSFLQTLPKEMLYTQENIELVASTLKTSHSPLFKMFYPNSNKVNTVMKNSWYAKNIVDKLILNEKVEPFLQAAKGETEPDWNWLYNSIKKDFGSDYAGRNVLQAKISWYQTIHPDDLKYAIALNDKIEKYGSDTTIMGEDFRLNNKAYQIFKGVNDVAELKRTIRWMAGVVRRGEKASGVYSGYWPLYIDTYAGLRYKAGETAEAVKWQQLAVTKGKELAIDEGDLKAIIENLESMKAGKPTW